MARIRTLWRGTSTTQPGLFAVIFLAALLSWPAFLPRAQGEEPMAGDAIEALLGEELEDGGIKPMPETGEGKLVRVERAGQYG